MNITMKRDDLARELALLEKIAAKKSTMAILSNVLIKADGTSVALSTTDIEIALTCTCPATVTEPGTLTLPVRRLLDLVRAQSHAEVTISGTSEGVKFSSGSFHSKLGSALAAADFPGLPPIDGATPIKLPRAAVKTLIGHVRFAVADKDQAKYYMKAVFLALSDKTITMVAADTSRLAVSAAPRTGAEVDSVLIPSKAVDELTALLAEDGATDIEYSRTPQHTFFRLDNRLLASNQIDGEFPDYTRIVPKATDLTTILTVDRQQFAAMIKRHVLIDGMVKFAISPQTLHISSVSKEGESIEKIPVSYGGPPFELHFKGEYCVDFLNAATGDTILIGLQDDAAKKPAQFKDKTYYNVIVPMQIS